VKLGVLLLPLDVVPEPLCVPLLGGDEPSDVPLRLVRDVDDVQDGAYGVYVLVLARALDVPLLTMLL
jgi:hypothetical protein